jgi:protein MpaA
MRLSGALTTLVLLTTLLAPPAYAAPTYAAPAAAAAAGAAVRQVIGRSVEDRPIVAFHRGTPGAPKAVVIATMHGNEPASRLLVDALVKGPPIRGVDLWLIPVYNPDGLARGTRRNAHGVDLNRNFPYRWIDLDGPYESGPAPASEPETRAVMAFLDRVRPKWIVSFHQPLYGVDRETKWPNFSRKLSTNLRLPLRDFSCGGVCHGTLTGWFNHRYPGSAVTVEYGAHPSRHRLTVTDPPRLLRALGGRLL